MRSTNVILVIDSDPRTCSFLRAHEFSLPTGNKIVTVASLGEAVSSVVLAHVGVVVIGINRHDDAQTIQNLYEDLKTARPGVERIFYVADDVVDFEIQCAQSDFHLVHKPFVNALLKKAIALMYEAPLLANEQPDNPQS